MKKLIKLKHLFFIAFSLIIIQSCKKNEVVLSPTYGLPTITAVNPTAPTNFAIGRIIRIPLLLKAPGFLQKVEIKRNNVLIKTETYTQGGERTLEFSTVVDDAWIGTTQVFTFTLFDKNNQQSSVFSFSAQISNLAPTYTIAEVTINAQVFKRITGTINFDEKLDAATKWLISGVVNVDEIATLTINPGTTIYAETDATSMNVLAGGKIIANGTTALPIVFTSFVNAPGQTGTPVVGAWLGLNINGKTGVTAGSYKYLRIEFGGKAVDAFRLTDVNNLTTVEYIQVFRSGDNGLRINGGNVNVKYIVATANTAVGIRYGTAWVGKGQFLVATMNNTAMTGIQGRDANSFPTLANITVTGSILNGGAIAEGEGIRIRNGAKARVFNALVTGINTSFRASDGSENFIPTGEVFLRNSASFNNIANNTTGFHSSANLFNPTSGSYVASNSNSVAAFSIVNNYVGTANTNSVDTKTIDAFFDTANYTGAVQTGSDWTIGWTRNINGTIR